MSSKYLHSVDFPFTRVIMHQHVSKFCRSLLIRDYKNSVMFQQMNSSEKGIISICGTFFYPSYLPDFLFIICTIVPTRCTHRARSRCKSNLSLEISLYLQVVIMTEKNEMYTFDNKAYVPDENDNGRPKKPGQEGRYANMTEEEKRRVKRGIMKNVVIISFSFMLLFTAFQSMANLQSSLNKVSYFSKFYGLEMMVKKLCLTLTFKSWTS